MSFIARFFDDISLTRYFGEFVRAIGGADELRNALSWSAWYALKWWYELYREGLHKSDSPFVKALYFSLLENGFIDRDGHIVKRVKEPRPSANTYAEEFLELHQSFDKLGAVRIAMNQVDENSVAILYSAMLTQGWYNALRLAFYRLANAYEYRRLYFPILREGHDAAALIESSPNPPELVVGYDYRADSVELAREILRGASTGPCPDRGICIYQVTSSCEVVDLAGPRAQRSIDAAIYFTTLGWTLDPLRELQCARRLLRQGAAVLVAQDVVESTPSLLAMAAAAGAKHVFRAADLDNLLAAAGYKRERVFSRSMPFYAAVWRA
ncbi:MAG: hypothetical protein TU35_001930 [Thermoproteus sp. AZ2]|uniref:Uncharacterized protein n=1 Tax=Thermoproteus sp. AZ2 TaxID=1609232 RepID=A0ACC6V049_9CREN